MAGNLYKDTSRNCFVRIIGDHTNVLIVEDKDGKRYTAQASDIKATFLKAFPVSRPIEAVKEEPKKAPPPVFRKDLPPPKKKFTPQATKQTLF